MRLWRRTSWQSLSASRGRWPADIVAVMQSIDLHFSCTRLCCWTIPKPSWVTFWQTHTQLVQDWVPGVRNTVLAEYSLLSSTLFWGYSDLRCFIYSHSLQRLGNEKAAWACFHIGDAFIFFLLTSICSLSSIGKGRSSNCKLTASQNVFEGLSCPRKKALTLLASDSRQMVMYQRCQTWCIYSLHLLYSLPCRNLQYHPILLHV